MDSQDNNPYLFDTFKLKVADDNCYLQSARLIMEYIIQKLNIVMIILLVYLRLLIIMFINKMIKLQIIIKS